MSNGISVLDFLRAREQGLYANGTKKEGWKDKTDCTVIEIDGNKISGYFEYFFFIEKTYPKEPQRSQGGVIDNLNSYATFNTPKVKVNFKMLSIDGYRMFMKLIESKNEFTVGCYDMIHDRWVRHKMYFVPQDYPDFYMQSAKAVGVKDYVVELIGTNASLEKVSVIYHSNTSSDTTEGTTVNFGDEVIIGNANISGTAYTGYSFNGWNDKADGTGMNYIDGNVYTITQDIVLYAQWRSNSAYTLSYDYTLGKVATVGGKEVLSKQVNVNSAIGELPTASAEIENKVVFNEQEYSPYTFMGWYQSPKIAPNSTRLTSGSVLKGNANKTIYAVYKPIEVTVTAYVKNNTAATRRITQEYGTKMYPPQEWDGKAITGWYYDSALTKPFDGTTPPTNIDIYAKLEPIQ